jgi:hypothetical protein
MIVIKSTIFYLLPRFYIVKIKPKPVQGKPRDNMQAYSKEGRRKNKKIFAQFKN